MRKAFYLLSFLFISKLPGSLTAIFHCDYLAVRRA